jgi:transposase-like protein
VKTVEREEALRLRREEGRSVKELAALLNVSRSTISLWVRDIELTHEQRAALSRRSGRGRIKGSRVNAAKALERHREAQRIGHDAARQGDVLHAAGCMLYWAEGSRNKHAIEFVNSDPAMVVLFLRFLRACNAVPDAKVRVTCNLFADHAQRQREIEDFWLCELELPRACLRRSAVNRYSKHSKKKRRNKLPYGTCRLTVYNTRLVHEIRGAIQEYGGFERVEWLM